MTIAGVGTGLSVATTASAALGELTQERAGAGSGVLQALKNTGAPQALRLFRLQGYQATTAERIAQPVEVSASTVFGYFPAKEALVFTDEHDPVIIAAIRTQPPDADPARAVRGAPGALSGMLSADELADMCQRTELALSVPGTPCRDTGPVRPGDAPDHRYRRGAPGGATTTSGSAPWPGQSSGS